MKAAAKELLGSVECDRLEADGRAMSDLDAFDQSFEALQDAPVGASGDA